MLFGLLSGCTQRIGFAVGVLILAQRQAVLVAKQAASLDQSSDGRWGACRSGMAGTPKRLSGAVHNMATATCRSLIPRARPHSPRSPNCGHRRARPGETRQRWGSKFGSPPAPAPEQDWRRETTFWKEAGVTHITAHTSCVSGHRKRIPGRGFVDHLTAITRYNLADAAEAHRVSEGRHLQGKLVLMVR